jgi:phosphate transport system substrate-binding protein
MRIKQIGLFPAMSLRIEVRIQQVRHLRQVLASQFVMNDRHSLCARLQRLALAFLALVVALQAHAQPSSGSTRAQVTIKVTGAYLLVPLVSDIARRFEEQHSGVKIDVQGGGSAKGEADVRTGVSNIGMLPRVPAKGDRDLFAFPFARDGIAVIVNGGNPLTGISTARLTDVLTGRISNWKALGGTDAPIVLGWRNTEGSPSAEFLLQHLKLHPSQIRQHADLGTSAEAIKFVASTKNGLAVASVAASERSARAGISVKLLAYNGVPAASRTIQSHLYPLSRAPTLITRRAPEGLQKQFIEYALSNRVLDLQLKHGFVPYEQ